MKKMLLETKTTKKYAKVGTALASLLVSMFLFVQIVAAAELRFNPAAVTAQAGDEFLISVVLDAGGQDINTIEAELVFPAKTVELVQTRIAGSIITFWVQEPVVKQSGKIPFGGTIIGGYLGNGGIVFSAVFKTDKQLSAEDIKEQITLINVKGFLNDGLGTPATITVKPVSVTISSQTTADSSSVVIDPIKDEVLPEPFAPIVGRDDSSVEGKWFVAFSTEDKQSGVAYYEIQESASASPDDSKWVKAASPYVLHDQSRSSYIHVRAVDAAGNSRTAMLAPGVKKQESPILGIIGIALSAVILFILALFIWRRRHAHGQ
jgi:hypothetical protein